MPVTRSRRARVEDTAHACAAPVEARPKSPKCAPRGRTATGKKLQRNDSALDTTEAAATARQRDRRARVAEVTSTSGSERYLWFDETVSSTVRMMDTTPPTLYVDDYHVLEEIRDLTHLRRGDHCMCALNPIRKLSRFVDGAFMHAGSWELIRLFHHFVLFDDCHSVDETDQIPLTSDKRPVTICEYSNTPCGAFRQIRDCGWRSLLRNPAAYHRLPLHDYTHPAGGGRYARGIFRVVRTLTDEDRTRITARCEELLDDHHKFPYDLFKINCESAAFHVSHDAHLATHKLSAQVPWLLWSSLRVCLSLVGLLCLYQLAALDHAASSSACPLALYLQAGYHLFSTTPLVLQALFQLVRATVHLTERRDWLGADVFHWLLIKEVGRACFVGGLASILVARLPGQVMLMHAHARDDADVVGVGLPWTAAAVVVLARSVCSVAFRLGAQVGVRVAMGLGGVPVLVFRARRPRGTASVAGE